MFRRSHPIALAAVLCLGSGGFAGPGALPGSAAAFAATDSAADPAAGLRALSEADLRVATIGFRLVTANAGECPRHRPATGLVLQDLSQYRPGLRAAAAALFALGPGLGVASVVPGSPAEAAGIRPNDRILAVGDRSLVGAPAFEPAPDRASDAPFAAKLAILEAEAAAAGEGEGDVGAGAGAGVRAEAGRGATQLLIDRAGTRILARLVPVTGCATRFQLVPGGARNAWSDGDTASLSTALFDFAADDDELAVVLGHELAHNILDHRARLRAEGVGTGILRAFGSSAAKIRATEVEADRLGLKLMERAGYRLAGALSFWQRVGASRGGLTLTTTHPGLKTRLALVREAMARSGQR